MVRMEKEMLDIIDASHQGIVKCRQRARYILYAENVLAGRRQSVQVFLICSQFQKAQPSEPMIVRPLDRPWSRTGSDLFQFNGRCSLLAKCNAR